MKKHVMLLLALLGACAPARPTYWTGFHGPAYLPTPPPKPLSKGVGVPANVARIRTLDSLTAAKWAVPATLFKP